MREEDNINRLFKRLEGEFDIETPKVGHQQRFLDKLNAANTGKSLDNAAIVFENDPVFKPQKMRWNWIAAACILFLTLGIFLGSYTFNSNANDLASVSPEANETQVYFTSLIETELEKVKAEENANNKHIIEDAISQLTILENDYDKLKQELITNGSDKRLLHAMISNFQLRINLLENVLEQLNEIKILTNESNIL